MDLGDVLWAMVAFFFWFMFLWMFIAVFADVFHRADLSGWAKAGWIVLIFVLPFIGLLIYMIARPRMTPRDMPFAGVPRQSGAYSPADEVAKLAALRDSGAITVEQYELMKSRTLSQV